MKIRSLIYAFLCAKLMASTAFTSLAVHVLRVRHQKTAARRTRSTIQQLNAMAGDRSKRQERVGQLVMTELGRILHTGNIRGAAYLEDPIRRRISVVRADVSPDLRQARISVSIRPPVVTSETEAMNNSAVDKRRAYSWLVSNTKMIRHSLAMKMSHMKSCPNLTFHQVDVSAAVDVMYLIDKVSKGYTRQEIGLFDQLPTGVVGGVDFDEDDDQDDEEEWLSDDLEEFI
jgi:ribosome-binding factor A